MDLFLDSNREDCRCRAPLSFPASFCSRFLPSTSPRLADADLAKQLAELRCETTSSISSIKQGQCVTFQLPSEPVMPTRYTRSRFLLVNADSSQCVLEEGSGSTTRVSRSLTLVPFLPSYIISLAILCPYNYRSATPCPFPADTNVAVT